MDYSSTKCLSFYSCIIDSLYYRSDRLIISTNPDKCSTNLEEVAVANGWWSADQGDLNFSETFNEVDPTSCADDCCKETMRKHTPEGRNVFFMFFCHSWSWIYCT